MLCGVNFVVVVREPHLLWMYAAAVQDFEHLAGCHMFHKTHLRHQSERRISCKNSWRYSLLSH
jgi:hypothetical protein